MKLKNVFSVLILSSLLIPTAGTTNVNAKSVRTGEIDITNILANPDVEVEKYTAEEYKTVILEDENLTSEEKDEMTEKVNMISKQKNAYDYWRIYAVCQVTSS